MADISSIRLRQLHGQLGSVVYELSRVQFMQFSPSGHWHPAINVYRCEDCVIVCADLAGVKKEQINLHLEAQRLVLRGERQTPEPEEGRHKPVQVLDMEIDYGPFEREVVFPLEVDTSRVNAEHRQGFLWVYLPIRAQG